MRASLLAFLMFLSWSSKSAGADLEVAWLSAPTIANAADFTTTEMILSHNGIEQNVLMGSIARKPLLYGGIKLGLGVGTGLLARQIAKSHPTRAKFVIVLGTLLPALAAVHNLRSTH
jgi:hypothetical protein